MEKEKISEKTSRELGRQVVHASLGVLLIILLFFVGRGHLIAVLSAILLIGSLIINWKILGSKIFFADWFERKFERNIARFPGYGSAWYIAGALMLAIFLKEPNEIAAGIFMLGVGDAASTVFGMRGSHRIPYNAHKTIEGSIAFFIFSLPAWFFIGWLAVPLAFLAAIAESLPLHFDDNVVVPAVAVLFFYLI